MKEVIKLLRLIIYQIEEPGIVVDLSEISANAKKSIEAIEWHLGICDWKRVKDELPGLNCDHLLLWDKAWEDVGFIFHGGYDAEKGKFWVWDSNVNDDSLQITHWKGLTTPPEGD